MREYARDCKRLGDKEEVQEEEEREGEYQFEPYGF